ncbi:hydrogenase maturation protease [Anaerolinea thermolimosa]|uniref:hydrogenase maturation protease n=1 Tax=Anaerolinea thermolimosa TaxID=229919 RepID=UPI0007837BA5|nr:hydrogenase maturation protease [Anaerolinea thermolimosa]GAP06005.1 hydrogenase maturation protease [Anaerolinea thermolimosa]
MLAKTLENAWSARNERARIAVVGIGNEFNGDDAAGVLVVKMLRRELARVVGRESRASEMDSPVFRLDNAVLIEAATAPENFTGLLRQEQPAHILLLDATWLDASPGTIAVMKAHVAGGMGASTHLQPLATLAGFLERELACDVTLVGVQPLNLGFDAPVSPAVRRACRSLATFFARVLTRM